jgi:hypothetical protein
VRTAKKIVVEGGVVSFFDFAVDITFCSLKIFVFFFDFAVDITFCSLRIFV